MRYNLLPSVIQQNQLGDLMSYETLAVGRDWPSTAQFTATADVQIALTNKTSEPAFFIVHPTRPTDSVYGGLALIHPGMATLTLYSGESVWIAAPGLDAGETVSDMIYRHY